VEALGDELEAAGQLNITRGHCEVCLRRLVPSTCCRAGGALFQTGMNFGALWGVAAVSGVGPLPPWRQFEVLGNAETTRAAAVVRQLGATRAVVRAGTPLDTTLQAAEGITRHPSEATWREASEVLSQGAREEGICRPPERR
jgi:hypothetical protein